MITLDQARSLPGRTMYGPDHDKIGTIDVLYADRDGGEPTFATVHTGLFGTKRHFVPLQDASLMEDHVMVPYTKSQVSDAPNVDPDGDLSPEEESRLYQHYGVMVGTGTTGTGTTGTAGDGTAGTADVGTGTVGHDTSGPNTDDAMTRSEEHLRVGKETVEAGRARLRKYVVTETETATVPVSREEVRVEREPITDGNVGSAYDGPAISEEEHEVVLHEEKPVVAKEATPVERVRLSTETVTEDRTVSDEVRKEQIDTDGVYPSDGTASRTDADVQR